MGPDGKHIEQNHSCLVQISIENKKENFLMTKALDRRTLLKLLGGSALSLDLLTGCSTTEPLPTSLTELLGLEGNEREWIADLTSSEQEELLEGLFVLDNKPVSERTIELGLKVLSSRSRLFAFIQYPEVADERSVCDGLIRE